MCGIAGCSLSTQTQQVDMNALARSLALGIEERGRDATGVAWHDETDSQVWIQKTDVRASEFVGFIDTSNARSLLVHTRFGTKGSKSKNVNNHPIEHHGIVGVHNGVIYNDDDIFAMLECPRNGQVDSEAAFALIARGLEQDAQIEDLLPLLEGSAALAWLNVHDEPGTLHLARVASSPLWVAQTMRGSLLFASTRKCLLESAMNGGFRIKYLNEIPEGSYLRVKDGRITDVRTFEKPSRIAPARRVYYPKRAAIAANDDWRGALADDFAYDSTYSWLGMGD